MLFGIIPILRRAKFGEFLTPSFFVTFYDIEINHFHIDRDKMPDT